MAPDVICFHLLKPERIFQTEIANWITLCIEAFPLNNAVSNTKMHYHTCNKNTEKTGFKICLMFEKNIHLFGLKCSYLLVNEDLYLKKATHKYLCEHQKIYVICFHKCNYP